MANFPKKLEDATKEELKLWINQSDPNYVKLASDELTRRALNKLENTIKNFNEQSSKQTEKMIELTRWIVVLTIAMVIGLIAQIYLAKIQTVPVLLEQERSERRAYDICKNNPQGEYTGLSGASVKCDDVFNYLKEKFE